MTVAISKSYYEAIPHGISCDDDDEDAELGTFAIVAGRSHDGRPKLTMARMVHGANISPAEHELLLRMAMRDGSRGEFIAIDTLTGEQTIVPFEEHLKIVGLSEEEWMATMDDAVTEFFTSGGDIEQI